MRQERNKKSNRRDQLDRFELFCKCAQMIHTCVFFRKVATGRETESEREREKKTKIHSFRWGSETFVGRVIRPLL